MHSYIMYVCVVIWPPFHQVQAYIKYEKFDNYVTGKPLVVVLKLEKRVVSVVKNNELYQKL